MLKQYCKTANKYVDFPSAIMFRLTITGDSAHSRGG